MHKQPKHDPPPAPGWSPREAYMLAAICLMVGLAIGYFLRGTPAPVTSAASATATPAANVQVGNPATPGVNVEAMAAPLKVALKGDPKNYELLVQLGNLYFDKQTFGPAIEYYRRALEVKPNDINVRTDLGTAYWYSGMAQQAINEYKKSLAIDPNHQQTLFNMGVVYKDGLKDPRNAIATWEKLLKAHPDHPERQRILNMIAEAKKSNS